jgi:hypothetical protein
LPKVGRSLKIQRLIAMNLPLPARSTSAALLLAAIAVSIALSARADVLELINGDRYQGTLIGMDRTNVEFQSEIQGRVKLPRDKVARVTLHEVAARPVAATNAPGQSLILDGTNVVAGPGVPAGSADAIAQKMRQDGVDPKIVNQVRDQVLGRSSPEAAAKFDELFGGFMSGKLSVGDIRAEAQNSINQIKAAKQDLGEDTGGLLDGYLTILEKFVAETSTNEPPH